MNEAEKARESRRERDLAGSPHTEDAPAPWLGQVTSTGANLAVGKFALCLPARISGSEAERAFALIETGTVAVPVYMLGPHAPSTGDNLLVYWSDYRWVTTKGPAVTPPNFPLPGCPCLRVPGTLYMHVAKSFPDYSGLVAYPATLQRGARPADLDGWSSDLTGWYSTTPFLSTDGSYKFRYWFGCSQGIYFVHMLATLDSPVPHREKNIVMYWSIGGAANTCGPPQGQAFSLTSGGPTGSTYYLQGITVNGSAPAPTAAPIVARRPPTGPISPFIPPF